MEEDNAIKNLELFYPCCVINEKEKLLNNVCRRRVEAYHESTFCEMQIHQISRVPWLVESNNKIRSTQYAFYAKLRNAPIGTENPITTQSITVHK